MLQGYKHIHNEFLYLRNKVPSAAKPRNHRTHHGSHSTAVDIENWPKLVGAILIFSSQLRCFVLQRHLVLSTMGTMSESGDQQTVSCKRYRQPASSPSVRLAVGVFFFLESTIFCEAIMNVEGSYLTVSCWVS
jgi:hypothetical protein